MYWGFERGKVYDAGVARATFLQCTQREGIPWIRTAPSFRAVARQYKLYYDKDGHLTPEGHCVLTEHGLKDEEFLRLLRHDS